MNSEKNNVILSQSEATRYRGILARLSFLAQDGSGIQFALKELGGEMSTPTQSSWTKMKRLLRYLKGVLRAVLSYGYQNRPKTNVAWADSDFAGCEKSRRSISAGLIILIIK